MFTLLLFCFRMLESGNKLRKYNEIKEEINVPETSWNTIYKYGRCKQKNVRRKWYKNNSNDGFFIRKQDQEQG